MRGVSSFRDCLIPLYTVYGRLENGCTTLRVHRNASGTTAALPHPLHTPHPRRARGRRPGSRPHRHHRPMVALLLLLGGAAVAGPGAPPPRKLTPAEIAPYPPMHWHSWGLFTSDDLVNEANMGEMAEALVSSGMAAAGYDTLNVVCNGWVGRDPKTGVLLENRTLWPSGIAGFAEKLHAMTPPLKVGCYTSPRSTNCMCGSLPQGGCEEGTGTGYEERDMEFFAASGCDHVMVDMPDTAPDTFKARYEKIGSAIASSSNPNMLYGVWCSSSHPERWAAAAGGHYWRTAGDSFDSWSSVLRQWDVAFSIPNIDRFSHKGSFGEHMTACKRLLLCVPHTGAAF